MPWLEKHNPPINWASRQIVLNSKNCFHNCHVEKITTVYDQYEIQDNSETSKIKTPNNKAHSIQKPKIDISEISASELYCNTLDEGEEIFLMLPQGPNSDDVHHLNKINPEDYEIFLKGNENLTIEQIKLLLPPEFHDYVDDFLKQDADTLASTTPRTRP